MVSNDTGCSFTTTISSFIYIVVNVPNFKCSYQSNFLQLNFLKCFLGGGFIKHMQLNCLHFSFSFSDIFKPDPNFLENEKRYEELKKIILGDESEDEEGSNAASDDDDDDDEDEDDDEEEDEEQMKIRDETDGVLVNLRRTIYLTIMSSVDFEEAGHKLLKIKLEPGEEVCVASVS